ncbi:UNKNOWN [Stylonychia lemnae]|uniref:Uncharacterized protein n=1 Tax=Stylonychia lemnae TaxID=5949 RepID=A0A078AUI3_STYLE|nr:UNKNOWN [Stylonychia lemnae]|eukprot:CDW84533.1 UNKNOWN [Stylonychia lemnae]
MDENSEYLVFGGLRLGIMKQGKGQIQKYLSFDPALDGLQNQIIPVYIENLANIIVMSFNPLKKAMILYYGLNRQLLLVHLLFKKLNYQHQPQ